MHCTHQRYASILADQWKALQERLPKELETFRELLATSGFVRVRNDGPLLSSLDDDGLMAEVDATMTAMLDDLIAEANGNLFMHTRCRAYVHTCINPSVYTYICTRFKPSMRTCMSGSQSFHCIALILRDTDKLHAHECMNCHTSLY